MTVEKPKPKQLLRPITTGTNSSMNQSQFLAITCNSPEAREISRVHGAIGFGFASHWLKNWRESFKPITKRRNRNHVITFDSHLETALRGRENRVTQGKTSRCRVEDLQTQPTHAADSGIEPAQGHSDGRRVFSLPRHPRT